MNSKLSQAPPVQSPKKKEKANKIKPSTSGQSFDCKEKQSLQSDKAIQEWLRLFLLNEPERTDGLLSYCHEGQN